MGRKPLHLFLLGCLPVAQLVASAALAQPIGGAERGGVGQVDLAGSRPTGRDRLVNRGRGGDCVRERKREMQALKQSLLDRTDNVARLRGQLREIEIQAESQMQSRLSHIGRSTKGFDPLEFDHFSRLQELTRFMAERQ